MFPTYEGSRYKACINFSLFAIVLYFFSLSILFGLIPLRILDENYNLSIFPCEIIILCSLLGVQLFTTAFRSVLSAFLLLILVRDVKFETHIKRKTDLWICVFLSLNLEGRSQPLNSLMSKNVVLLFHTFWVVM
jgi:hypothetical protein